MLRAPFPYFGGKRKVAPEVWAALGDVQNYVEPFAGSLAVLLARPETHTGHIETVNDKDRYIANFWRALQHDPEEVAKWADWPVNEADLEARHLWLVNTGRERIERMFADPDFYDAKVAGWWVWGLCAWIGSGWCADKPTKKRPHLGNAGQGINRQLPHLGNAGRGINRQLPHLGDAGRGIHSAYQAGDYLHQLAARLRNVRVCCGDWQRVITDGATAHGSTVGVFLDPPYSFAVREGNLYSEDCTHVAQEARDWAISKGDDPRFRIVLAGYFDEHESLIPATWRRLRWKSSGAYAGGKNKDTATLKNRHNECLWFSPHCLQPAAMDLFPVERVVEDGALQELSGGDRQK